MSKAEQIRKNCGHPIIDSDGHMIESFDLLLSYVDEVGGPGFVDRLHEEIRRNPISTGFGDKAKGISRAAMWSFPTDARDLATAFLPGLMYERTGELGLDHIVLYPTLGISLLTLQDDEVRHTVVRAYNLMNHELYKPYRDRLTPVACIPMHTPGEALSEVEYITSRLAYKACCILPGVARPVPDHAMAFPVAAWLDCYGIDSPHDYVPVWRGMTEAGLAVTCHAGTTARYQPGQSRSWSNYSYNHVRGHAYFQEQFCKSLVFAGAPAAVANGTFAFLEGGIGWVPELLYGIREHWERRSLEALERNLNPARIDRALMKTLLGKYADPLVRMRIGDAVESLEAWAPSLSLTSTNARKVTAGDIDDFRSAGFKGLAEMENWFTGRFYFGCEAEDPGVTRAFNKNASGIREALRPIFGSDIGHWDVTAMDDVVPESYGYFVEGGRIKPEQWRDFVCDNAIELWTARNPEFFDGTSMEKFVNQGKATRDAGTAVKSEGGQ